MAFEPNAESLFGENMRVSASTQLYRYAEASKLQIGLNCHLKVSWILKNYFDF